MRKIAHYRRVIWLSQNPQDMKKHLDKALAKAPDVADTKFEYRSDTDAQITARDVTAPATGVYFTLFKEGRRTALIENGGAKVIKRKPPRGEEFLRTGIMLVVVENHLAFLADGHTNDGQITALLQHFFKQQGLKDSATQFLLQPKANQKQLARLLKQGVKSIDLGLTSFAATVDELNEKGKNSKWMTPIAAIGNQLRNAMKKDRTPAEIEAASEIEVRIHLGYDGRGDKALVSKLLGQLAIGVEDNAAEFKIVTNDDAVITHDKLVIKMEVEVSGDDVASDHQSAFDQLKHALVSWKKAGVFDQ
ncbi:Hypothetical protein NGAL_HAMBI2605_14650 [Neorhizobium galegae bv. orientalis]|nr:Hypothetical protein NGAL_HAMBI2605_14650 [Neorhizobium galegae bv. orientalis]